jgi:hypothetical protein
MTIAFKPQMVVNSALLIATMAFAQGVLAQDPGLGTGLKYSFGDYDAPGRITLTPIPLTGRYETGPWRFRFGGAYEIDKGRNAGISFDAREKAPSTAFPLRELTFFYSQKFDRNWKGQAYYLKGLSNGGPDWGAGATATYSF